MAFFNAFQIILLFATGPFLIQYAKDGTFYAHSTLSVVLVIAYLIGFGVLVGLVAEKLDSR